jgi:hypothetical protein
VSAAGSSADDLTLEVNSDQRNQQRAGRAGDPRYYSENPNMRLAMQLPVCVSESDALMAGFPPFVQQFDCGISPC